MKLNIKLGLITGEKNIRHKESSIEVVKVIKNEKKQY